MEENILNDTVTIEEQSYKAPGEKEAKEMEELLSSIDKKLESSPKTEEIKEEIKVLDNTLSNLDIEPKFIAKALEKIYPNSKFIIYIDKQIEWIENKPNSIDAGKILEEAKKAKQEFIKNRLTKELLELCDFKHKEAEQYIAGVKVTQEQLDRYKAKYKIAKNCIENNKDCEKLETEAALKNISTKDLANLIIQKGQAWEDAVNNFYMLIESFRVKVSELINKREFYKAKKIISVAYKFDANTSKEDIEKLF